MQELVQAIEVFALVTGVAYVVLEILQKNAMWVLGLLTGAACAFSFAVEHVWASMVLNLYYVGISVVGFIRWKKAGEKVGEGEIHLATLPRRTALASIAVFVLGSLLLIQVLRLSGDQAPELDAVSTVLGVIATWWLAQSYIQQWLLWVVADILLAWLCLRTGQHWMALLYLVYVGSAVYGYFHWKKRGKYVN